jgi:hypothetical protein
VAGTGSAETKRSDPHHPAASYVTACACTSRILYGASIQHWSGSGRGHSLGHARPVRGARGRGLPSLSRNRSSMPSASTIP